MRYVEVPRPRRPEPRAYDPYLDADAELLDEPPLDDETGDADASLPPSTVAPDSPIVASSDISQSPEPGPAPADSEP
jgi:hypothetical protein